MEYLILLLFTCVLITTDAIKNTTKSDFSTCKEYISKGYVYKQYYEIKNLFHSAGYIVDLHFSVQSSHDAHILLTPATDLDKKEPVYEIVLGAGRNTFSDLRRLRGKGTKGTSRTAGLLSIFEMRSFWLHISTEGLIEVGREGEDLAFLSWKDVSPLPVRFLSFSSWPGVEAKWLFDCKPINKSTEQMSESYLNQVEKPLTQIEQLRKQLLTNYDPYIVPETDGLTYVFLAFTCEHVHFDEKKSLLSISGKFDLQWQDEKMVWNSSEFDDITSLVLSHREIWMPTDLFLFNSADTGGDILQASSMKIEQSGYASWSPKTNMKIWCLTKNIKYWPYNDYDCELSLGFWTQQNLIRLFPASRAKLSTHIVSSGWDITHFTTGNTALDLPWIKEQSIDYSDEVDNYTTAITIYMKLTRRRSLYTVICFSIQFITSFLLLLIFCVSPTGNLKITLSCLIIVLLTGSLLALTKHAPSHPIYVPGLINTCQQMIIATAVALTISIIVICLSRNSCNKPLPSVVCNILSHHSIQTILLLPKSKGCNDYGKLNSSSEKTAEIQEMWIALGTAIDRLFFIIYTIFISILFSIHY
uniref:Nicotinic acetylcholine receptor beta2 n=1 Tax=Protohermes xanthodes TaxID=1452977 RepID=A0AAU6PBK1_9NEOP